MKVGARRLVLAGSLVNLTGVLVMGVVGLAGEFSALAIFLPMCSLGFTPHRTFHHWIDYELFDGMTWGGQ